MKMLIRNKIINTFSAHSRPITFGIGLIITFAFGTAVGMMDHYQAFAIHAQAGNANGGESN